MTVATASTRRASVRYLVDDVDRAVDFYTTYLGFTLATTPHPLSPTSCVTRCAAVSGPTSSGARPIPDGSTRVRGGWNRIHLIVDDITGEVARARVAGLSFRNNIISGPVGQQIPLHDPAANRVELFHSANRLAAEGVLDAVRPA